MRAEDAQAPGVGTAAGGSGMVPNPALKREGAAGEAAPERECQKTQQEC